MAATIRGAAASALFLEVLVDLGAQGLRTHCSDPGGRHLWLSEDLAERAEAARLCIGFPVQLECWDVAVARRETWGVWGGVDRTKLSASKAAS